MKSLYMNNPNFETGGESVFTAFNICNTDSPLVSIPKHWITYRFYSIYFYYILTTIYVEFS